MCYGFTERGEGGRTTTLWNGPSIRGVEHDPWNVDGNRQARGADIVNLLDKTLAGIAGSTVLMSGPTGNAEAQIPGTEVRMTALVSK